MTRPLCVEDRPGPSGQPSPISAHAGRATSNAQRTYGLTHFYENIETGRPFTTAFNIGEMLDTYDTLRAQAPTPQHIVPGHDREVMRRYPPPKPELEGIVVRLDVAPKT